ncbi:MAG: GNAT family N-acetyltransferase [Vampirovibrionales bacterium]
MQTLLGEPFNLTGTIEPLVTEGHWQAVGLSYLSPREADQLDWLQAAERLYYRFLPWAYSNFGLEVPPPPNLSLTLLTQAELLRPVALVYVHPETQESSVVGLAILKPEAFDLLEIHQVILAPWLQAHPPEDLLENSLWQQGASVLLKGIFKDIQGHHPPYLTVSFPLLGIQETLFDVIQQVSDTLETSSVVSSDVTQRSGIYLPSAFYADKSPVTISRLDIRHWQQSSWGKEGPPCPDGLTIRSLKMDDTHPIEFAKLLHTAFSKQTDTLWEPRYKTLDGCLELILQEFHELSESLLLTSSKVAYNASGYLVGFALMKEFSRTLANIPLVCVHPDVKGQGLGKRLVYRQLLRLQELRRLKKTPIHTVTVTHQASETAAQRLYMSLGFTPHAQYLHAHWNRSPAIVDLQDH